MPLTERPRYAWGRAPILCQVLGCDELHAGRGLCHWHLGRWNASDEDALAGPRPAYHCTACGVRLSMGPSRVCIDCRPIPLSRGWVNPFVCECPDPDLDGLDQCRICWRKPLARFRILQSAP